MTMDAYDYVETDETSQSISNADFFWNVLTGLILLTTLCVAGVFLIVFTNPQVGFNPFPPPTKVITSTPTPTFSVILPDTWTPTIYMEPTTTNTPSPPTATAIPGEEGTVTPEPTSVFGDTPFVIQDGDPKYIANIYHQEAGCNWLGLGGQVFDLSGAPLPDQYVQLGGTLDGESVSLMVLTGLATSYGNAGYEFEIAEEPIASSGTLWVQLVDQAGLQLSAKFYFDTFSDCDKNLVLINFKQVH